MKTLIPALVILAVAIVLLGVKVLFVRGGKFPSGHVHDNPTLRERGIGCATKNFGTRRQQGTDGSV